jgi:hypothetical protein
MDGLRKPRWPKGTNIGGCNHFKRNKIIETYMAAMLDDVTKIPNEKSIVNIIQHGRHIFVILFPYFIPLCMIAIHQFYVFNHSYRYN